MYMDFNTFTRMFFYLFICYHYAKYNYPEKTEQFLICMGYNSIYLYSKLQILFYKNRAVIHEFLMKYEEYQKIILFLEKIVNDFNLSTSTTSSQTNIITIDFILNNEIHFSFEKQELINDYLSDFFPDNHDADNHDTETNQQQFAAQPKESILSAGRKALERILLPDDDDDDNDDDYDEEEEIENDPLDDNIKESKKSKNDSVNNYDLIIVNCEDGFKKIIKHVDLIKNDFVSEYCSIFEFEPFLYKPILCEFFNGDNNNAIKIDFCDSNNQSYNFLVVGNCFDKTFLTYFMKKYYDVDVEYNYILKIIDNNVNTHLFDRYDILKFDENCISKIKLEK